MAQFLEAFITFGWRPTDMLSEDENFMDLTLLITRSSQLKDGSMACILVRPVAEDVKVNTAPLAISMLDRIISVSTNKSLYRESQSDIHAEIAAIGQAARVARPTDNCTAYITMPPCRRCFAALLCAGVQRIVSRHASPLAELALKHGIDMLCVSNLDEQRARVDAIVHFYEEQFKTAGGSEDVY